MHRHLSLVAGTGLIGVLVSGCGSQRNGTTVQGNHALPEGAAAIQLKAADGATIYGHRYQSTEPGKKVILCFHQARSSAWEYAEIAPRFVKDGFDVLAIDQRSGGDMFGHPNLTAAAIGGSPSYMDAYPDLEATLAWAKNEGYKTIVACGSSYSASLVFKLAADHPEVSAVMAFSPGEYEPEWGSVALWAKTVGVPRFVTAAGSEGLEARHIFDSHPLKPGISRNVFCDFPPGVHGASTLIKSKNGESSEQYWEAVEDFLRSLTKDKGA